MTSALAPRFNVRAYGIWLNSRDEVLVCEEVLRGRHIIKFPGGGLEFGEGLVDCLKREWMEETGLEAEVIRHYYTTDFFQPSAARENEQVLSVYYLVRCEEEPREIHSLEGQHTFRWIPLVELTEEAVTLPIDRVVASRLRHDFLLLAQPV